MKIGVLFMIVAAIGCETAEPEIDAGVVDAGSPFQQIATIDELIHLGPSLLLGDGRVLLGGATATSAVVFISADRGETWTHSCDVAPGGSGDPVLAMTELSDGRVVVLENRSSTVYVWTDTACAPAGEVTESIARSAARMLSANGSIYLTGRDSLHIASEDNLSSWQHVPDYLDSNGASALFADTSGLVHAGCCLTGPAQVGVSRFDPADGSISVFPVGLTEIFFAPIFFTERSDGPVIAIGSRGHLWEIDAAGLQTVGQILDDNLAVRSGVRWNERIVVSTVTETFTGGQVYAAAVDDLGFAPIGVDGHFFDQALVLDDDEMLWFEMLRYDGTEPTRVYRMSSRAL